MADANQVVTVDTANMKYVKRGGVETEINGTSETFPLRIIDLGTTGIWEGGGSIAESNIMALADGSKIRISKALRFTHMGILANATAIPNPGSIWIEEDDGIANEWKITTMTVADADGVGANNITTMTMERADSPIHQVTWTNLNTA